jgi:RND family efflux transporter MFP subunit
LGGAGRDPCIHRFVLRHDIQTARNAVSKPVSGRSSLPRNDDGMNPSFVSARDRSLEYRDRIPIARLTWTLTLRIAFFGGWLGTLTACHQQTQTQAAVPAVHVTTAKPIEHEVVNYAEFTGNTAAVSSVDIRARVTGYLDKIGFSAGSIVKTGDLLFVIDQRPYQATLDQAQANVDSAKAQLELAQANFERSQRLMQGNVIDAQTFQTQLATRDQVAATLSANQAALETAKLNLGFTEIRSPIDGQTSVYNFSVGNLIIGGDNSSSGILTTVVSIDPIWVYFNADERSLLDFQQMVQPADRRSTPVQMKLANESTFAHTGVIDFVDNQVDPATGTIRVRGVFPNKDRFLRPGLFAEVRVPISAPRKSLLISDLSVGYDQGQPIVYVIGKDNVANAVPVKLGVFWEGLREIESGIAPDDRIVVNGIVRLRSGIPVEASEGNMADFAGTNQTQVTTTADGRASGNGTPNASPTESKH